MGALAFDANQGDQWGWAIDYETQAKANARALKECGQGCSVVLTFKNQCATFVADQAAGSTAYGWAKASTRSHALAKANNECIQRGGTSCLERIWGCDKTTPERQQKPSKPPQQDDFWSGKSNTLKDRPSKPAQDDFWAGSSAKDQPDNTSAKDDFWRGQGTQAEEQRFEGQVQPDESDKLIGDIRSRTKRIKIVCRDHGEEDGDRVRISNNGSVVHNDIYLTNAPRSYWLTLGFGINRVEISALNEGSSGPNTAEFEVYDDAGHRVAEKEWNLRTGFKGTLLVLQI